MRRAGIYVDGRLVKRLPVSHGNLSNFSTTFRLSGGTATIRAFGAGNQYVESSIAMPPAVASAPPIVVAPYGMNPYSPFGMNPYPMDPYGSPYGSPFGTPYGTPYGSSPSYGINISPFGITRYPVSPYGASPYGASPTALWGGSVRSQSVCRADQSLRQRTSDGPRRPLRRRA